MVRFTHHLFCWGIFSPAPWCAAVVAMVCYCCYPTKIPPKPTSGRWTGYYIEMMFDSGTHIKSQYHFTTPGFTWPDTLPFADCQEETCVGRLL